MALPAADRPDQVHGAPAAHAAPAALWRSVDGLIERASLDGILAHKLGPLAANRLLRLGRPVPQALRAEGRAAALANAVAVPLIERIREASDGPLLLFKGPEVARMYPGKARRFVDIDLLVPDASSTHAALKAHGFVDASDDPEDVYVGHAHLRELKWPTSWLKVEVHSRAQWPEGVAGPPLRELIEAAVPSRLGIGGVSTLSPLHQTLVLASHAWVHEPLDTLRDLVDIAAAAAGVDDQELDRTAQAWGIRRVWRTTQRAIDGLFYGGKQTVPLRAWAQDVVAVRERTVFENHMRRWLNAYWELPPHAALARTVETLLEEVRPAPGERRREKLLRVAQAVRNPKARADAHSRDRQVPLDDRRHEPPHPLR
jgi:hypothetical protein